MNPKFTIETQMFENKHLNLNLSSHRFEVSLKEGTCMVWKASTVQLKNVKVKNVASFFDAEKILDSPAVTQAKPKNHDGTKTKNHPLLPCTCPKKTSLEFESILLI